MLLRNHFCDVRILNDGGIPKWQARSVPLEMPRDERVESSLRGTRRTS